ncbi:GGDEF domain-containing phosphodiesterase [Catenovulum maritimum]|uniref:Diguanylate cyclase n=1 Tax=Catenovulum maritimum TaxID=1513271 RepID=A0A0J8H216_9ALTE|nr:GGDEF domain-containing phosphodiesterase [Catenovulum maritimum]KMT67068.1 hypothetical protein XM47_00280 [Catenovulum maritimum]
MYKYYYKILDKLSLNSLKARVVLTLFATSLLITVIIASAFSAYQFIKVKQQITLTVHENINSTISSLSEALWSFKEETVSHIVAGLNQSPYISAVEVISDSGKTYAEGVKSNSFFTKRDLSFKSEQISPVNVGTLQIWLNQSAINKQIYNTVYNIILVYLISALVIALITIKLIDAILSRHLSRIATGLQKFDLNDSDNIHLQLDRPSYIQDELTSILDGFNTLRQNAKDFLTTKEQFEQHLTYQANFDDLTKLANRRYGLELLNNKIKNIQDKACFSILFIDLDGFKEINDTHYHLVGDELLKIVAKRLTDISIIQNPIISRIGGDEFMMAINLTGAQLNSFCNDLINAIKRSYIIAETRLSLSCSIGIAMYPADGDTATSLISNADTAMYQAKLAGKSQFKFYSEEMSQELIFKSNLKTALKTALARKEIQVYFQPIFAISDAKIVGFEALCRWNHKEYGPIRPDVFIALAEETGDIVEIDRYVLCEVIKNLAEFEQQSDKISLFGTVNFCPLDFEQKDLTQYLNFQLEKYQLTNNKLEIEVTERSMLAEDETDIKQKLEELANLGVKIAIDDFGTGYSALSYVKNYRSYISKIKVDRLFVRDIEVDHADAALINSIISMAKGLGMKVVAEGIETEEQKNMLETLGCQYGQGYLISKPIPIEEFKQLVFNTEN